jgi:sulfoxide reductase catalytic subunit YedY
MYKNKLSFSEPPASEITPEPLYLNRRAFLKATGLASLSLLLAACGVETPKAGSPTQTQKSPGSDNAGSYKDELGNTANSYEQISQYNNYYEFTEDKESVAVLAKSFDTSGWKVEVGGLVEKPHTYSMDELLKKFPQQDRVYRLRCVEAWSMVIPWTGFPLSALLKEVQPASGARFVKFTSALLPDQMPGAKNILYPWPYTEGLRLDEAQNDLTFLATGLYGKTLPNSDGAPIRLVVPWKYGFKSAKALVKIELTAEQPPSFWNILAPNEYGFYSNVNPEVDHPRWSQATERRIGELGRRKTLPFNGYAEQVASLYAGMDLRNNY